VNITSSPAYAAIALSNNELDLKSLPKNTIGVTVLILNVSLDVVHELFVLGSDLLQLAPIPGLSLAAVLQRRQGNNE